MVDRGGADLRRNGAAGDNQHGTTADVSHQRTSASIFFRFLRFGLLAWGGPVAQIAMLRRELVDEERWITMPRFNRLLAIYQVLPGPEAHELSVHLGMLRGGRLGGLLAGLGFMLPGLALMLALSWLYFRVDLSQAAIGSVLLGAQVGVIALIVRAVERIGRHILVNASLLAIGVGAALASLAGASFWLTLPIAGAVYVVAARFPGGWLLPAAVAALAALAAIATAAGLVGPLPPSSTGTMADPSTMAVDPSLFTLFVSGLKAGLLTFGGAYTVIPFLRDDAVGSGWMSDSRFLDGLALSGILPAPLIIFSTFVGYVAAGFVGALAMTAGIFLPAFGLTLLFGNRLEAVIENNGLHTLLEGVAAGVVGLIVATTVELAVALVERLPSLASSMLIFTVALAVLFLWRAKTNVIFVIVGAGLAGWFAFEILG